MILRSIPFCIAIVLSGLFQTVQAQVSWESINNGLPSDGHVSALTRDGQGNLYTLLSTPFQPPWSDSASYTTGTLFFSSDNGDSWNRLPGNYLLNILVGSSDIGAYAFKEEYIFDPSRPSEADWWNLGGEAVQVLLDGTFNSIVDNPSYRGFGVKGVFSRNQDGETVLGLVGSAEWYLFGERGSPLVLISEEQGKRIVEHLPDPFIEYGVRVAGVDPAGTIYASLDVSDKVLYPPNQPSLWRIKWEGDKLNFNFITDSSYLFNNLLALGEGRLVASGFRYAGFQWRSDDPNTVSGLYLSTDDGESWERVHDFFGAEYFSHTSNGTLFAENKKKLLRSCDDGRTWQEVNIDLRGVRHGQKSLHFHNNGIIYAPASSGVMESKDEGETWRLLASSFIPSVIAETKTGHLVVGTSGKGMFRTSKTLSVLQERYIVGSFYNPSILIRRPTERATINHDIIRPMRYGNSILRPRRTGCGP